MNSSPPRKRGSRATARNAVALGSRFRGNDSSMSPRVLHVAAELFPWVKTGGLGDVTAALPPALAAIGVDARLVLPGFSALLDAFRLEEVARLRTPFAVERVRIARGQLPDSSVSVYLVDHPAFYEIGRASC